MSVPVKAAASAQPEAPAKGKQKAPQVSKPKKPRQPWGMGPWLLILALVVAGAAVAVLRYPIPGLTVKPPSPTASNPTPKTPTPAPTSTPTAPEDLLKREKAVAEKEAELAAREKALQQKEAETAAVLKDLGITGADSASQKQVSRMYGSMAPYKAAPLMAQLDVETAVEILRLMTHDEAAAILSYMDPDRGAQIMRQLAKPLGSNPAGG